MFLTLLPLPKPSRMQFTASTKPLLPTPVKYDNTFNPSTIYKTYGAGAAGSKAFYPFVWHLWVIYPVKCLPR
jgi:hypothetical protein